MANKDKNQKIKTELECFKEFLVQSDISPNNKQIILAAIKIFIEETKIKIN